MAAHGDDGTNAGSSAAIVDVFIRIICNNVGILFYVYTVYHRHFGCVAAITTVGAYDGLSSSCPTPPPPDAFDSRHPTIFL